MCGRITQHRGKIAYLKEIGWDVDAFGDLPGERIPNWNVPPGSHPWLMHRIGDGKACVDMVNWGYRPAWAAEKGIPIAINARLEKAATGSFFRALWKSGRAIVPADGWYEWTGESRHKQPWYIRLKTDRPMFMAAITDFRPDKEPTEGTGFSIVTAAAEGGLVDVHDRRPVVFSREDAELWMDITFPLEQAEHLARSMTLPSNMFEWHPVSTEVNKAANNGESLIQPILI